MDRTVRMLTERISEIFCYLIRGQVICIPVITFTGLKLNVILIQYVLSKRELVRYFFKGIALFSEQPNAPFILRAGNNESMTRNRRG